MTSHGRRPTLACIVRDRITYANLMSTVAAFLALAGGSTAIALKGKNTVKKDDIASNAVRYRHIAKGAVRSWEVKNETLKLGDIGPGAVGAGEIVDGAVRAPEIASGAVGSAELLDGAVGTADQASVPVARIQRTAPLSAVNNIGTTIALDTESSTDAFDPFDMWDPSDPTNVFVPIDGIYLAIAQVEWDPDDTASAGAPGDAGARRLQVSAPDIGVFGIEWIDARTFGAWRTAQTVSGIANLNAGDNVRVTVAQDNEDASTVDVDQVTLQVIWLGPGV